MWSPSRLHFINTGCCQKGQINTQNCAKPREFQLSPGKWMQHGPSKRDGKGWRRCGGASLPTPSVWEPPNTSPGCQLLQFQLLLIPAEIKPCQGSSGIPQKLHFLPFHHQHFSLANFEGLVPSLFVPHQQLEFLVLLILLEKKSKKKGKCQHPGLL